LSFAAAGAAAIELPKELLDGLPVGHQQAASQGRLEQQKNHFLQPIAARGARTSLCAGFPADHRSKVPYLRWVIKNHGKVDSIFDVG